jgi:hypothetical protein
MMSMNFRWLLVAAAAFAVAGCYKTPNPNCTFQCGAGGACPTDYTCGPDNICHLMTGSGLAACGVQFDDAAAVDSSQADAKPIDGKPADASPIDAHVDAKVDAKVDAHVDAKVDANVDANLCPAITIMDDGSQAGGGQDLVISLVQPNTGGQIELFNTTAADIVLNSSHYQLVVPGTTALDLTTSGVTVKAHGYATVAWPAGFGDESSGGELVLYGNDAGRLPADIRDFVCWDTDGNGMSAKADAQTANKWSTATPACAAAITGTALERKTAKTGTLGADYDATSTRAPRNCP